MNKRPNILRVIFLLFIVLFTLAALILVATPGFTGHPLRDVGSRFRSDLRVIEKSLNEYRLVHGEYPESLEVLVEHQPDLDLVLLPIKSVPTQRGYFFDRTQGVPPVRYRLSPDGSQWAMWYSYPSLDLDDAIREAPFEELIDKFDLRYPWGDPPVGVIIRVGALPPEETPVDQ